MGPWGLERKSSEKKPAEGCRRRGAGCPRPRALLPAHEGTRGGVAPVSHLTFNLLWQPPDSGLCAPCPSPRTASQCLGRSNHSEGRADMSLHTRSPSRPPSAFRMKPSCRVPPATPGPVPRALHSWAATQGWSHLSPTPQLRTPGQLQGAAHLHVLPPPIPPAPLQTQLNGHVLRAASPECPAFPPGPH